MRASFASLLLCVLVCCGTVMTVGEVAGQTDAEQLTVLRRIIRALKAREQIDGLEALRDVRVRRWRALHMGVSQEDAAEAGLPIVENMPDLEAPAEGATGTYECEEMAAPPPPENRVTDLHITRIATPFRGYYQIYFTYHIRDIANRYPLTFDCLFDDAAVGAEITQAPWMHAAPVADFDGTGVVGLWIDTPTAPLAITDNSFYLRARGPADQKYARVRAVPANPFYKSYDMITSVNIEAHFADAAFADVANVGINEGPNSLAAHMDDFSDEPTMLMFQTADGAMCRGLFRPHDGAQGLEAVWLLDLDCFRANGPSWYQGHVPADLNDHGLGMRSYDVAGLLTPGVPFDLDWGGFDCTDAEGDIVMQVNPNGKLVLRTTNGCRMRY